MATKERVVNVNLYFDADTKNYHKYSTKKEDAEKLKKEIEGLILSINEKSGSANGYVTKNGEVPSKVTVVFNLIPGLNHHTEPKTKVREKASK